MPEHNNAVDGSVLQFSDPPVELNETKEVVVPKEEVAAVETNKENSLDIAAIIKAHEGDPDWSEEELEKAFNDPHVKFDPEGKKSPGEFNRSSPLFSKIKALKSEHTKEMNRLRASMEAMEKRLSLSEERGYKKALSDIQERRLEAVDNGNKEAFAALDKEYAELQQAIHQVPAVNVQQTVDVEADSFFERNPWAYGNTPEDAVVKDDVAQFEQRYLARMSQEGKTISKTQHIKQLEAYAKSRYPQLYENPNTKKAADVEGAESPRVRTAEKKVTMNDLDDIQQAAAKRFIKNSPGATLADYLKLLDQAGGHYKLI